MAFWGAGIAAAGHTQTLVGGAVEWGQSTHTLTPNLGAALTWPGRRRGRRMIPRRPRRTTPLPTHNAASFLRGRRSRAKGPRPRYLMVPAAGPLCTARAPPFSFCAPHALAILPFCTHHPHTCAFEMKRRGGGAQTLLPRRHGDTLFRLTSLHPPRTSHQASTWTPLPPTPPFPYLPRIFMNPPLFRR